MSQFSLFPLFSFFPFFSFSLFPFPFVIQWVCLQMADLYEYSLNDFFKIVSVKTALVITSPCLWENSCKKCKDSLKSCGEKIQKGLGTIIVSIVQSLVVWIQVKIQMNTCNNVHQSHTFYINMRYMLFIYMM